MIRGRFSISTLPDNKRRTGPEVFSDPRRRNTYNYAFTGSGIREAAFDPGPCISRDAGQYLISVATAIRINNSSIAGQRRGAVQRKLSNRNDRSQRKVVPITYYLLQTPAIPSNRANASAWFFAARECPSTVEMFEGRFSRSDPYRPSRE